MGADKEVGVVLQKWWRASKEPVTTESEFGGGAAALTVAYEAIRTTRFWWRGTQGGVASKPTGGFLQTTCSGGRGILGVEGAKTRRKKKMNGKMKKTRAGWTGEPAHRHVTHAPFEPSLDASLSWFLPASRSPLPISSSSSFSSSSSS